MLITSYNQPAFGDTLIAITGPDTETQTSQRSGDIVAILDDQNHVIGYNFFNVSQWLGAVDGHGQIQLTAEQVAQLNVAIQRVSLKLTKSPSLSLVRLLISKIIPILITYMSRRSILVMNRFKSFAARRMLR